MTFSIVSGVFMLCCWALFLFSFARDRSRYRNCYFLSLALASIVPFALCAAGPCAGDVMMGLIFTVLIITLIVPFFLIHNGTVMIRREGRHLSQLLSLALGLVILAGEVVTFVHFFHLISGDPGRDMAAYVRSAPAIIEAAFSVTVIYGAASFLMFMLYTLFLQLIPRKKDFDYVIIHGAGLLDGQRVSKLLRDRLDKAIEVYRQDPTPPALIPSGGKGADETVSEAEAMKDYLLAQGIPEEKILLEDQSATTYENLQFSRDILEKLPGRKYTALVTSNYHVYRALRYCRKIGLKCTGIGSHVAFYYWPSALIREFIAIHAEKKRAVLFVLGWVLCLAAWFLLLWHIA